MAGAGGEKPGFLANESVAGKYREKAGLRGVKARHLEAGGLGGVRVYLQAAVSAVVTRSIRTPGFLDPGLPWRCERSW